MGALAPASPVGRCPTCAGEGRAWVRAAPDSEPAWAAKERGWEPDDGLYPVACDDCAATGRARTWCPDCGEFCDTDWHRVACQGEGP